MFSALFAGGAHWAIISPPRAGGKTIVDLAAGSLALELPLRLTDVSSWQSHIPFAFWCVEALRPRVLVELGTHRGDSYCAFCQAVDRLSLSTACHAVDTWRGDPHAGFYGDEILQELCAHHDPRYGKFSRLVRATFDEAVQSFPDGSIDLLHVDGLHTYEAVRHDFETWLPKLSRAAVVLFHDTSVREADFGVWRFWEEVSVRYPSFSFVHGHGLGVLVVGDEAPEAARRLVASSPEEAARVRGLFAGLGTSVELRRCTAELEARLAATRAEAEALTARLASADAAADGFRRKLEGAAAEAEQREARCRAEGAVRDAEIRRLDEAAARLGRVEAELREIKGSRAWRIARAVDSLRRVPRRLGHGGAVILQILYWAATLQLRSGLRGRKYARLIRRSGLFKPDFYLSQLPDPKVARRDPIWHYVTHGAAAGLDPNPLFDGSWYADRYPDVRGPGKNPLVHYIRKGEREQRRPSASFDPGYYTARYPDVPVSGMGPLAHYLAWGMRANRVSLPGTEEDPSVTARALSDGVLARAEALVRPGGPPRVLVVDHRILTPDQDSGSVRMFAIVKLLRALGHEVTFVADIPDRLPRYEEDLRRLGVEVVIGAGDALAHLAAEGHRYRIAILSRPEVAQRYLVPVRAYAIHAAIIYDTVDLHWVRMLRAAEITGDSALRRQAERFKVIETVGAACVDRVLAITPKERDALVEAVPGARVDVVPNVHSVRPCSSGWAERKGLMFIGGFEHTPNVDAVEWFVAEVLPLIRRRLPNVVLQVVGSKAPESIRRLASEHVHVAGYVPDPAPFFDGSRVFVSPLRYGAGMKGKIGHAMSHGLPVVTTSIGAEGMLLADGENALVADAADAFAAAVVRLHEDELLWSRLARAAARHVEEHFSEDVVRARLAAIVAALEGAEGAARSTAACEGEVAS
jgi:glycosyltransferase involved in cell wall biosynthesis